MTASVSVGRAAILRPSWPRDKMRRETSAALVVRYLRQAPEWGSKVLMVREARGAEVAVVAVELEGVVVLEEDCCCCCRRSCWRRFWRFLDEPVLSVRW
jgi:hypothetical protein